MKSALESNDGLGFIGMCLQPFPSCKDYVHLFYLALTRLWAIYHLLSYAHVLMFTLHVLPHSMLLPCDCDPCLHLPMIHHFILSMCICMIGGDTKCYCHVYLVNYAIVLSCVGRVMMFHCYLHMTSCQYNDDTLLISNFSCL